jgi:hypothetical protein
MKLKLKALAAVAAVAATALVATPGAALADWNACPDGKFCLFDGPDGTGEVAAFDPANDVGFLVYWDNRARSSWNRTTHVACVYKDTFQSGTREDQWWGNEPGQQQNYIFDWDRAISSIGFGGCAG